jgi:Rrf2 family nitric oxide-sensitive transcriptional repressor
MKLTTYSNYTMRVLMVAAARSPELATVGEVARGFAIAETHIVKCVHSLGQWGYLETVRGRGGGFRLARPAQQIRVGEILRRTEDGFAVVECMDPATNRCLISGQCALAVALQRATEAFLNVLDALTLADICGDGARLLDLVGLSAAIGKPGVHCSAASR